MSQPFIAYRQMIEKSKLSSAVLYGSLAAFSLFVVYVLYANQEVFYTAHDRSEFIYGATFFHSLMSKPFGLMQYVGAWLTLLFSKPAFGSVVMVLIWILIYWVGTKAFRLKGNAVALMLLPIACLLTSVVDLGYWIYIYPPKGYWFSQSVAYLLMLLLLWMARATPRRWHLAWYLLALCAYPVLGWFALLFVICLALTEKPSWCELLALFLLFFTASTWRYLLYSNLKPDDVVMAGFPQFITPLDYSDRPSIPFWVLGAVTVLIPLCSKYLAKWFVPVLCAAVGIIFTFSLMFRDQNYIKEMRMVRYAYDDNWKEVLNMATENPRPTFTMMFLQNIALMNEGGLLDRSFKLGDDVVSLNNPDKLHVTLLDIASPLVYYNYGLTNEAIRLSFENAIQAGFSPFYLKMLARCALANGDEKLVERYTTMIRRCPFYGDWQPAPVSEKVKELQQSFPDELTGVENSDSYLVNGISLWYETDSKLASEQGLFYAMLRCDSRRFWASLRNYVRLHMNEEFPLHAQEAYIMFMDKSPEEKRMMLPVQQSVYDRYNRFWETLEGIAEPGMKIETVSEKMRGEWGDTYWFYNLFGRKVNISPMIMHEHGN